MVEIRKLRNPLTNVNDQQWLKLVRLLTENVFALNSRKLSKAEILYTDGGHYPAVYFRLTTILESPTDDLKTEVSGFVFGFNNDWDDDIYIHPLSPQGFWEEWLKENQITSFFTYHEVGIRKIYAFLEKELKIWEEVHKTMPLVIKENEWRELNFN